MSGKAQTDAAIASRIVEQFNSCGYADIATLSVRVSGQTVTLEGTVVSYYLKQVAQEIAMSTNKVTRVCNMIEVVN